MVQAAALRLLQPFSESLDEAPVNKTQRLHRSFSRADFGCAVVAAVSSHLSSFLSLCVQTNTEGGQGC